MAGALKFVTSPDGGSLMWAEVQPETLEDLAKASSDAGATAYVLRN